MTRGFTPLPGDNSLNPGYRSGEDRVKVAVVVAPKKRAEFYSCVLSPRF